MIFTDRTLRRDAFEAGTGWSLTPEGACKGNICVPLPGLEIGPPDQPVDVPELARAMNLPLVGDEEKGVWAVGPESIGGRALTSVEAVDFELPRLDGEPFRLSSLRGQRVVVYAWAPY